MDKRSTNPIRVLIICDHPFTALGQQWLIGNEESNLKLIGAKRTVAEALDMLPKAAVDIIIFDIDGAKWEADLNVLQAVCAARIIVLSASRDIDQMDAAVLAGASGVVNKRDPVEVLLKAIDKVQAGEFWVDRSATMRILVAMARQKGVTDPERERILTLTRKERLTVAEVARDAGTASKDIALRLHISEHTLRNHLSSIYAKLGLSGRMELYAYAHKHGLNGRATR